MVQERAEALVAESLEGLDLQKMTRGQVIDIIQNIFWSVVNRLKDEFGGEEALEDLAVNALKKVFDRWKESNRIPNWIDDIAWNFIEKSIREAI